MKRIWRTLVVDDEKLARKRLKRLLSDFKDNFEIIGEAENTEDAYNKIESLKPELVFLDIEMPGQSIFKVLKKLEHNPFIVFCTAYDQYSLQAFETYSVDYLLKPVDKEKLIQTIDKLNKITNGFEKFDYNIIKNIIENLKKDNKSQSIPYKVGDKTILVKLSKVVYFEASDKYVDFYDNMGKSYLTDLSLKELEQKLSSNFKRISKSLIINGDYVKEIHKYFRGKMIFYMDDINKTKLTSGSYYSEQIKKVFDI